MLEAIFGECLNYKSGLRILIGALEVPFFGSQRWALLAKVPVFGPFCYFQPYLMIIVKIVMIDGDKIGVEINSKSC